ncbi:MAG: B12-binding domain-containing radical SAM protein, partial [Lachnospiraceae bacterium]|nr:B12-binding domain-containing radical SAM protein [Lachnospiraceae bacterium]
LEGVFARGDRKLSRLIYDVYKKGAIFDAWTEFFDMERYKEAFSENNIDIDFYITRKRADDEIFPWEHIDVGVSKKFLLKEWHNAKAGVVTPNCRMKCSGCGAAVYKGGVCFEAKNQV